jgi:hypothetical protein
MAALTWLTTARALSERCHATVRSARLGKRSWLQSATSSDLSAACQVAAVAAKRAWRSPLPSTDALVSVGRRTGGTRPSALAGVQVAIAIGAAVKVETVGSGRPGDDRQHKIRDCAQGGHASHDQRRRVIPRRNQTAVSSSLSDSQRAAFAAWAWSMTTFFPAAKYLSISLNSSSTRCSVGTILSG